jgi:hypothetical protein
MTTALDLAVTRRYGAAHRRLRDRFALVAATAWAQLGNYDEADLGPLTESLAHQTAAARTTGATHTAGYLNHFTGTRQPADIGPLSAEAWLPPFLTTWGSLKRGVPYLDAVAAGQDRMMSTAAELVTASVRDAAVVIDDSEPKITGWNRVPSGSCCAWCAEMALIDWGSADAASLGDQHANCGCDIVPITDDSAPGQDLNAELSDAPSDAAYVTAGGDAADRPTTT